MTESEIVDAIADGCVVRTINRREVRELVAAAAAVAIGVERERETIRGWLWASDDNIAFVAGRADGLTPEEILRIRAMLRYLLPEDQRWVKPAKP
jgi:hypothetical protein